MKKGESIDGVVGHQLKQLCDKLFAQTSAKEENEGPINELIKIIPREESLSWSNSYTDEEYWISRRTRMFKTMFSKICCKNKHYENLIIHDVKNDKAYLIKICNDALEYAVYPYKFF